MRDLWLWSSGHTTTHQTPVCSCLGILCYCAFHEHLLKGPNSLASPWPLEQSALGLYAFARKLCDTALQVRMLGDSAAVVSYIRLQQKVDTNGRPLTIATEESRVWEKKNGNWKNVHFHRSPTTPSS